jgi:hypothetical protein
MKESLNISTEIRRTYTWICGETLTIENPVELIPGERGDRVSDAQGNGYYIPKGWLYLHWVNKPGAKAIVA